MRTTILLVLLSAALPACTPAPSVRGSEARSSEAERDLRRLTEATIQAVLSADAAFFERLLAEDYVGTAVDGRVIDKATFLATFQPAPPSMNPRFEVEDVRGRLHGGTAVMNARPNFRAEVDGQPISQSERTTQVFVRRGGRWVLVAEHSSPIASAAP